MERINHFPIDVQRKLKNYVYALVDPRPGKQRHTQGTVFYIGRGVGDRVFSHEHEAQHDLTTEEYAKLERIREIERAGYHVKRWIISWGLSEREAQVAEGALIDFFEILHENNYDTAPTNRVAGYHNDTQDQHYLRYDSVEEINARLSMPTVSLKDLKDAHIGLITLGKPTDPRDTPNERLLGSAAFNSDQVARRSLGTWVVGHDNDQKIKYLLVVTHGDYVIVGAFKIIKRGNFITKPGKYQRQKIYWRDTADNKDQPLATNHYVEPVTTINGVTVGPNVKLGDVWFNSQQSGLNIVDNK
ncbi:MAG TPA: GIY-YIG nuclease family protein [Candidatus Limosilactobacillus merdipullorum]|uniref:GIY-YIG nuclease family protein n=1 Tax=Candidatus Limosilactobacillus merdipullorum TaxID=2838653 RepID=A0A9D1QM84_9LACO|nr:GIY-YIG nuclease family protein [Candidatus Limosilactobacillus merdipullorum]